MIRMLPRIRIAGIAAIFPKNENETGLPFTHFYLIYPLLNQLHNS